MVVTDNRWNDYYRPFLFFLRLSSILVVVLVVLVVTTTPSSLFVMLLLQRFQLQQIRIVIVFAQCHLQPSHLLRRSLLTFVEQERPIANVPIE